MIIKYKCRCMKEEMELPVPDRRKGGSLDEWMHMVMTCISTDHRALNVLCNADKIDELFIPYEEGSGLGIGEVPTRN